MAGGGVAAGKDDLFIYVPGSGTDTLYWGESWPSFGTVSPLPTPPGLAASYRYDSGGLRAGKTVNGTSTAYTWSAAGGLPLLLRQRTGAAST